MLKIEKELLSSLTPKEKEMMDNGFSICDIVWGRFNSEMLYIRNCDEFNDYYSNLIDYAHILEHEKDYSRSTAVNVQVAIIETSGLNLAALGNGKYEYLPAKELSIYGGPFAIIQEFISKHRVKKDYVDRLFVKMNSFLPKSILPFKYLSGHDLTLLMKRLNQEWSRDPSYVGTLEDLMCGRDFTNSEKILIQKGYIKVPPKEEPLPTLEEMMNDPRFE